MLNTPIQLYNGKKDNLGTQVIIEKIIQTIQGPSLKPFNLKKIYAAIQSATDAGEKEVLQASYDKHKGQLPAVTWSGTFTTRKAAALLQYSQLICLDIDKLNEAELSRIFNLLKTLPFVYIIFTSPSGAGLKVIVRLSTGADEHKAAFIALEKLFATHNIIIDKSGKDVSRLCFLCHDPNAYYNANATSFTAPTEPIEEPKPPVKPLTKKQLQGLTDSTETAADVFHFTSKILAYTEGNRNRFIYLFANNCNRKGISMVDCSNYSFANFTDREAEELRQTIENAYNNNSHEHAKFKKQNGNPGNKNKTTVPTGTNTNGNRKHTAPGMDTHTGALAPTGLAGKENGDTEPFTEFWKKIKYKKGKGDEAYWVEQIILSRVDFSDFLFTQGFHLLSTGKEGYQICKSNQSVIKPVEPHNVKQDVLQFCRKNNLRDVEEMLRKGQKQYFAFNELDSLPYKKIDFQKDTQNESFFYFNNCWVSVTAQGIKTHAYTHLNKHIWEGNKIDHDFTLDPIAIADESGTINSKTIGCEFGRFIYFFSYNPHNPDEKDFDKETILERFSSISTAYGYLLDGYKHPAIRKGIFAIDHKIGDRGEQHGRTGKSILPKAAGYLKVVKTINGKSFNPLYQFRFELITMDAQVVNFNDMPKNFDVEGIFEVIADDYSVTRRNNGYVDFNYSDSPKVYVSTNFIPKGEGSSYSARMHIIEASDYFSDTHSPYDEFGHSLFTDWDKDEWNRFYNFSLQCVQWHKEEGLVKYPKGNFDVRKLVNDVVPEFIDFMDEPANAARNERLEKITLLDKFNTDLYHGLYNQKLKPHTFHKWVKQYCKIKNLKFNPHKKGNYDKSNGKEYYLLADADYKPEQQTLL